MLPVPTTKVLMAVNAILGILEMGLIVLVSKSFVHVSTILHISANYLLFCICILFCRRR